MADRQTDRQARNIEDKTPGEGIATGFKCCDATTTSMAPRFFVRWWSRLRQRACQGRERARGGMTSRGGPPEREDFGEQTAGGLGEDGGLAAWALFVGKVLGAVVRDATAKDAATGMYILQQVFQIGSL